MARQNRDEAKEVTRDSPKWGLTPPKITVIIRDTNPDGKGGEFYIGDESGDRLFVYCNSSEREREVLAVKRSALAGVLDLTDINTYRVRRLLEGNENSVKRIELKS